MPLVVPGILPSNAKASNTSKDQWSTKLLGKTLVDDAGNETSFSRKDLPKNHRIIENNAFATTDFDENRLNIYLAEDGTVRQAKFG